MSDRAKKAGKYGSIIQQARKPENQIAGKPDEDFSEASTPAETAETEEMVNLSIRVSKRRRRHWSAEAKRLDTTLVATITQALVEKFGEPESEL